jgi:hypothetical protein
MNEAMNSRVCERAEDLISFLYGELGEPEARSFEQHRRNCPTCESELAGFGSVHESVIAWRDQALGLESRASLLSSTAPPLARARKRSALAAVHSFFELSPLWMKAATAFAAVLFCLLAGLAVLRSTEKTSPAPLQQTYTTKAIDAEVKRRVEAELAKENGRSASVAVVTPVPGKVVRPRDAISRSVRVVNQAPQKLRKPLTRAEREQLAADLRLISGDDEDSLELLGDRINPR